MSSTRGNERWRPSSRAVLAAGILVGALSGTAAHAQSSTKDAALAETLFEDAKKRMATGDYAGACPKLAESYRLDPGTGTLTALAVCHEQIGKTASAWAEYVQVVTEAQRAGRADREKFARQHAAALEPTLSRITINVAPETARLPDLQVRRDKVVVGAAAWGVASPIDPGDHVIEAVAPGKKTWSTHVTIGASGDRETVSIPSLEDGSGGDDTSSSDEGSSGVSSMGAADAKPPENAPAETTHSGSGQRVAGIVVGALGLVSLGAGAYFGVETLSKSSDAKKRCPSSPCTDQGAVDENKTAKTDAILSDVTLGAGLVAAGVGLYLILSAPSGNAAAAPDAQPATQSRIRFVPWIGRDVAGLGVHAAW